MYAMDKLKKDIDNILEEVAEKGIKDCKSLEMAKTALSAKSKILTIEAMERVNEDGFSRRGGYRDEGGQFREGGGGSGGSGGGGGYGRRGGYRDEGGEYEEGGYSRGGYRDGGKEYLHKLLSRAEPHEREVIEKMMHKL